MRASFVAAVATAAVALAAATAVPRDAAAQAAAPRVAARTNIIAPAEERGAAAVVRPAATFRFARGAAAGFPAEVTVADSAGQIVASYRLDGERNARGMAVTVIDTSLVLQAETPSGLLTVLLDGQNAPPAGAVTGRWWLGDARGALRGRTR